MRVAPTALQRLAASTALVVGFVAAVMLVSLPFASFPSGLVAAGAFLLAVAGATWGAVRRSAARALGMLLAAVALAWGAFLLVADHVYEELLLFGVAAVAASAAGRVALGLDRRALRRARIGTAAAPPARHGVLFVNPRSGGGKALRLDVAGEARSRGIEPVVLREGDDLAALAAGAVARGADVLGVAGGDGSQSVVAAAASAHGVPFVCVPAGTRNHFALDLGVEVGDVVGALDAFADGDERRVDLGRVNGRVFVNNVSVGLYAHIVATGGYRAHKLATAAQVLPDRVGPGAATGALRYVGPDSAQERSAQIVLVSNNPYLLTAGPGMGSRPRLDGGVLGIVATQIATAREASALVALHAVRQAQRFGGWHAWTAPAFSIASRRPTEVGIDGEAAVLDPPLQFAIAPAALRVRVARRHSGVSPAAVAVQQFDAHWLRRLVDVARGRAPARA